MTSVEQPAEVNRPCVAIVGASGFVGSQVTSAIERRGVRVVQIRSPRLHSSPTEKERNHIRAYLVASFAGCRTVVNAAGVSEATGSSSDLYHANALLPEIVAEAAREHGARFVHVSTAAVQGRAPELDSSLTTRPFSPYSASKAEGERRVLHAHPNACIYRPPGVHGENRDTTATLARFARSPLSVVSAPGTYNAPQALIENVGDAIAHLALTTSPIPRIVNHPSEDLTVADVLTLLGGRRPHVLPRPLARGLVNTTYAAGKLAPQLLGHARRLEVLLFGQDQAASWLPSDGWKPPADRDTWRSLGRKLAQPSRRQPAVLIVTSVASMVNNFLLPHIRALQEYGLEVQVAANFSRGSTVSERQIDLLRHRLRQENVPHHDLPFTRTPLSLGNILAGWELTRLLHTHEFRFIHAHTPTGGLLSRLVGAAVRIPVVYTAHGLHFTQEGKGVKQSTYRALEKLLSRATHLLIAINSEDFIAISDFRAKNTAYTAGIGVREQVGPPISPTADLRELLSLPQSTLIAMSIGELNENKNHELVIRALAEAQVDNLHYAIVGHGDSRHLSNRVSQLNLSGRVSLLGYQPEARHLLRQADMFIFPSFREGLPIALAEAMLEGVPIIASNIRGNRDLVWDGVTGLLFDPNNPSDLIEKIYNFVHDPRMRQGLAHRARQHVQTYTIGRVLQDTLMAYHKSGLLPEFDSRPVWEQINTSLEH